jgi:hypothetical protein
MINWNDKKAKISKYFTVHEATYLPSWHTYHNPSETEKANILALAEKLDFIRELINLPIEIHCWIRPTKVNLSACITNPVYSYDKAKRVLQEKALQERNYNAFIGSTAKVSAHIIGNAVDFTPVGPDTSATCKKYRAIILPYLEKLGLRMEDIVGAWIHVDRNPVKTERFFKP